MADAPGSMKAMKRMSLRRFGQIVAQVMETLPDAFRPYLENVVVDVEEEPDERTLRRAGFTAEEIAEGDTLFGLFDPLQLPTTFSGDAVDFLDVHSHVAPRRRKASHSFPHCRRRGAG